MPIYGKKLKKIFSRTTRPKMFDFGLYTQVSNSGPHALLLLLKWGITHDFLFVSLNDVALLKLGLLLKGRICSWRSKFLPFKSRPIFGRETNIKERQSSSP